MSLGGPKSSIGSPLTRKERIDSILRALNFTRLIAVLLETIGNSGQEGISCRYVVR